MKIGHFFKINLFILHLIPYGAPTRSAKGPQDQKGAPAAAQAPGRGADVSETGLG